MQSPLEVAAWLAFVLKEYKKDLEHLPKWFVEGENHWDLVPPAVENKQFEQRMVERAKAYEKCPKCVIDREYARLLRSKFRTEFSDISDGASMIVQYSDRIFSMELDKKIEVIASGENWPSPYQVQLTKCSSLPKRFESSEIIVCIFDGYLKFDWHCMGHVSE